MTTLSIIYQDPAKLVPADRNARTHSPDQIRKIAVSIERFGFNNPVLVDRSNRIIAGHGRVQAALQIGKSTVPTVMLDHLSEAQKRAYLIADNRLAELAGWDREILAIEIQGLIELNFEITDLGFDTPEIDALLIGDEADRADPADDIEADLNAPAITQSGDMWIAGDHIIFCGDSLDEWSFRALLGSERAQLCFSDPPYNVRINRNVSGLGRARHSEFAMASGEMSSDEFRAFLVSSFGLAAGFSDNGAIHYVCMDWRHLPELFAAASGVYSEIKNVCVWVKTNGGMGSLYRSQHEMIAVMKVGTASHINNVELGRHGRHRTNVWQYAGMNSFQKGRNDALAMHPTVKPLALVTDAIYDCSTRGAIVLDPFGGSGTTMLAAHRAGRRARLIEIEPKFVDITLHRFARETGIQPIHAATGVGWPIDAIERGVGDRR